MHRTGISLFLAAPAWTTTPQPTVVYFHGGFRAAGSKDGGHGQFKPDERSLIHATVREFLQANGLPAANP